ncbi:hypothetical protein GCM10023172_22630 [Hymenobacter ginsengisoli]|uniref:Uncharacterized protein n=1 Tax=Hymenobacter ginsengisoli TaxID=1051626 RepID=A0ABP8QCM2_9BACT|nr:MULTISPECIES: hypothetical protein [unclassified Hymenobacter]MBO2031973.1 hypothetical protein [Hymenobacter sp. BT559]
MNPRDLPEVVSELIIEMHEVRSELKAINGRLDRLESRMEGVESEIKLLRIELRHELKENSRSIVEGITRGFEPFLNRLLEHDDQLRNHAGRLRNLENPQPEK